MATKSKNSNKSNSKKQNKKSSSDRQDPFINFNFRVEIDGLEIFGFKEVDGLANETEVIEYKEGGVNNYTHKFVGQSKHSNITLKYGITNDKSIYEWRKQVLSMNIAKAKRTGTIKVMSGKKVLKRWSFYNAWPSKWEGPSFDALADAIAIDKLELAVERIEEK